MSILHIQLLGNFRLTYGDSVLTTISAQRMQALLAYLLLHADAPQSRQHLAFLLWPASSESQARSNLRKLLYQLRQALPDPDRFLCYNNATVQWKPDAPYTTDVGELEQLLKELVHEKLNLSLLTRLVEQYCGELLPDCYEDWVVPRRQYYQRSVEDALERLVTLLENQRAYAKGARYAQRLLELDPLEESRYQRLMRLRAFRGDRAGALHVYYDCVRVLERELGVKPGPATQQLYEKILNVTLSPPAQAAGQSTLAATISLVGRTAEWQQLCVARQKAVQGRPHLVAITGEAGIGKTRLAEELLVWASRQGILHARTHAYAAQGDLAYAPITELLRTPPLRARLSKLSDLWLAEVARILPELLTEHPGLVPAGPLSESWQRQRFFEALARAILIDEQPLLLLFDDLHWCNQETVRWLHYLLHFAPQSRLLIVGTLRSEEVNHAHPLSALQLDLHRSDQWTEVALAPLNQAEVTALASQLSGVELTGAEADQLYQVTEGNPLFVVETVRAGGWRAEASESIVFDGHETALGTLQRVPPKVYAVIRARLDQLSPQARELGTIAATIGRAFTLDLLAVASNRDEGSLVQSLDELWQRRIVREQGANRYDFSHDCIREVAYAAVSRAHRRLLHQWVAQAFETIYANRLHEVSGQLADHWAQAGQLDKAVSYYQQAAETARQIHANTVAIAHYRRALVLLKQLPAAIENSQRELALLLGLGPALRDIKGYAIPELASIYTQARQLSQQLGDGPEILPVLHGLTEFYRVRAEYANALVVGEQMVALAQQLEATHYLVIAYFQLGVTWFTRGILTTARAYLEQSLTFSTAERSYPRVYTRFAHLLWMLGYPEQALTLGQAMLRLTREQLQPSDIVDLFGEVLELRLLCGELAGAGEDAEMMLTLIRQYDLDQPLSWATYLRGWSLALQGRSEGVEQMEQGLNKYLAMGGLTRRTRFLSWLAEMSMHVGRPERAAVYLNEADHLMQRSGERFWEAELYRLKGELLLLQQDDPQLAAETCFRHALETAHQQQAGSLALRAAISLSRLWQKQGRRVAAYTVLAEVYGRFTEGFATRDLQTARQLLDAWS